jgi:hypothetical protein
VIAGGIAKPETFVEADNVPWEIHEPDAEVCASARDVRTVDGRASSGESQSVDLLNNERIVIEELVIIRAVRQVPG